MITGVICACMHDWGWEALKFSTASPLLIAVAQQARRRCLQSCFVVLPSQSNMTKAIDAAMVKAN